MLSVRVELLHSSVLSLIQVSASLPLPSMHFAILSRLLHPRGSDFAAKHIDSTVAGSRKQEVEQEHNQLTSASLSVAFTSSQ